MTAEEIVRSRRADWVRLESLLANGGARKGTLDASELAEVAALYRAASGDTARVRASGADEGTVAYLDALLARAHNRLYRAPPTRRGAFADLILRDFPRTLRAQRRFFYWAAFGFYVPFFFGLVAAAVLPTFGPAVMGPDQIEMFRQMYKEAPETARSFGEGTMSVGYYVQHNTSIAFQIFANGIFAGLGSAFMLVYQGLVLGTVFGYLIGDEKGRSILTFTCGHSAWELTALVVSGAAGLRMGWALVATNGATRFGSLRAAGPEIARLIGGAALMLAVAACIEGLWSPSPIPAPAKWAFAGLQILVVTLYLTLAGRDAPASSRSPS
jgi:uncharacterized membrane protein SpoIIM required for sporulation